MCHIPPPLCTSPHDTCVVLGSRTRVFPPRTDPRLDMTKTNVRVCFLASDGIRNYLFALAYR